MKKTIAFVMVVALSLALAMVFAACGNSGKPEGTTTQATVSTTEDVQQTTTEETTEETTEATSEETTEETTEATTEETKQENTEDIPEETEGGQGTSKSGANETPLH